MSVVVHEVPKKKKRLANTIIKKLLIEKKIHPQFLISLINTEYIFMHTICENEYV
jgi:hypothetical protein